MPLPPLKIERDLQYRQFVAFAEAQMQLGKEKAVIRTTAEDVAGLLGKRTIVTKAKGDWVGIGVGRLASLKTANNTARKIFKDAIARMFYGEANIPQSVRDAMKMEDYGKGKPLTARRINAVRKAIDQYINEHSTEEFTDQVEQNTKAKMNACIKDSKALTVRSRSTWYEVGSKERSSGERADKLIETAFKSCGGDTDAMDIIKKDWVMLKTFIQSGAGNFRSEEYVRKRVEGLCANLTELRSLDMEFPGAFEYGKKMLLETGKPLQQGLFSTLVRAANEVPLEGLQTLSRSPKALEIHLAFRAATNAVEDIMVKTGADEKLDGAGEKEPARQFLADMMIARFGKTTLETLKSVLSGRATSILMGYYEQKIPTAVFDNESVDLQCAIDDACDNCMKYIWKFSYSVHKNLQRFSPSTKEFDTDPCKGEPRINWKVRELNEDIKNMAVELLRESVSKHVDRAVKGGGAGAETLKRLLHKKYDGVHESENKFSESRRKNVSIMRNWAICGEMKKLAAGDFSSFEEALKGTGKVVLEIGSQKKTIELSRNKDDAMDQLAQFVTGRADAKYADDLKPSDRNQIHYMMAMLSRKTEEAEEMGAHISLDEKESDPLFKLQEDTRPEAQNIKQRDFIFRRQKGGGINMECYMKKPVSAVVVGNPIAVGAGSSFYMDMYVTLDGEKFNQFMAQDFSTFDDDKKVQKIFGQKGVSNRLVQLHDSIPEGFKLDLDCSLSVRMTLNPTEQELLQQQRQNESQMQGGDLIIQG